VTVISLIGYGVGSAWQSVAHGLAVAGYVIFAVAVVGIAAFIVYRVREVRREGQHAALSGEGREGHAGGPGNHAAGGRGNHAGGRGNQASEEREPQPKPRSPMS
jgi:hypothetical protein